MDADHVAQIAELREAQDALGADIMWHEEVRAHVEERLAEAYERRAVIEVELRRLRALTSPASHQPDPRTKPRESND